MNMNYIAQCSLHLKQAWAESTFTLLSGILILDFASIFGLAFSLNANFWFSIFTLPPPKIFYITLIFGNSLLWVTSYFGSICSSLKGLEIFRRKNYLEHAKRSAMTRSWMTHFQTLEVWQRFLHCSDEGCDRKLC